MQKDSELDKSDSTPIPSSPKASTRDEKKREKEEKKLKEKEEKERKQKEKEDKKLKEKEEKERKKKEKEEKKRKEKEDKERAKKEKAEMRTRKLSRPASAIGINENARRQIKSLDTIETKGLSFHTTTAPNPKPKHQRGPSLGDDPVLEKVDFAKIRQEMMEKRMQREKAEEGKPKVESMVQEIKIEVKGDENIKKVEETIKAFQIKSSESPKLPENKPRAKTSIRSSESARNAVLEERAKMGLKTGSESPKTVSPNVSRGEIPPYNASESSIPPVKQPLLPRAKNNSFLVDVSVLRDKPPENALNQSDEKPSELKSSSSKEQNLFDVCRSGNIKRIEEAIQNGMDINGRDYLSGQTPLMLSILKENVEMAKLLLENKADPNLQLKDSFTALHLAVSALIEGGADVNIVDAKKRTPLDICAEISLKSRGNALDIANLNKLIRLLVSEKGISGNNSISNFQPAPKPFVPKKESGLPPKPLPPPPTKQAEAKPVNLNQSFSDSPIRRPRPTFLSRKPLEPSPSASEQPVAPKVIIENFPPMMELLKELPPSIFCAKGVSCLCKRELKGYEPKYLVKKPVLLPCECGLNELNNLKGNHVYCMDCLDSLKCGVCQATFGSKDIKPDTKLTAITDWFSNNIAYLLSAAS